MNESVWFEVIILMILIGGIVCIVFATWYDLRQAWLRRRLGSRPGSFRRPRITAIITAQSSEGLADCIRSVRRLPYRQCDIIVTVPSGVHKAQKRAIRDAAPGCRIYIARKQVSKEVRIRNAYRRSRHGDFVLLLDGSQTVVVSSLTSSIQMLQKSGRAGVLLSPMLLQPANIYELAVVLGNLTWRFIMKAMSVTGMYWSNRLFSGRLVKRDIITRPARYRYVFDSGAALKGVRASGGLLLHVVGYVALMVGCAVLVYAGTLAARLQTVEPLWLLWTVATLWMAAVIWLDDSLRFWRRIEYTLYLPVSFFVVMSVASISAIQKISYRRLF